jgi:hydrogenase nickel incorporation protein HypB
MEIEVLRRSIFENNEKAAQENRQLLDTRRTLAINIMGGAGCGKTTLLEQIIPRLRERLSVAVLEGDLATTKDADRIAALGVPVIQLLTEGGCHLTATLVEQGFKRLPLEDIDLVLIENVGNPICPVNFHLGEHLRIAVLSVTEGDDKPAKYPYLFKVADLVVVTKADLIEGTDFDRSRALSSIRAFGSDKEVLTTSMREASTMRQVADWIESRYRAVVQSGAAEE